MPRFGKTPFLLFLLMVILLSACQQTNASPPTATAPPETTAAATETPQLTTQATDSPTLSPSLTTETVEITEGGVPLYGLTVLLDYEARHLFVEEYIFYTNTIGEPLEEIPLIVPPAEINNVFTLNDAVDITTNQRLKTNFEGSTLWVTLPEPLQPDKFIQLHFSYELQIPESRSLLGSTDRQLLLTDWYPFVPRYLPESGWLINKSGAVGEYLTYPVAEYDVTMYFEPTSSPLVITASLPLYSDDYDCLFYSGPGVRNVTFAFSPDYLEFTQDKEDVTIKAYVFPEHAELGQRAADLAADAWAFYENLYGNNPREYMAIIEADLNDGMEYDGAFLLSQDYFASADDTPQNYFELLIVHETAHQWFYAQIANDQANEPWLDEALATYSELLYLENTYPELVEWWWNYRVYTYQPTGWVDSTIYRYAGFRPYVNAVYLRGVQFLDDLRQQIGDEAFFAVLRAYATPEEIDTLRTAQDFFDLIAQFSGEDISNLVDRYFQNAQP